jgi:hypothetical protein
MHQIRKKTGRDSTIQNLDLRAHIGCTGVEHVRINDRSSQTNTSVNHGCNRNGLGTKFSRGSFADDNVSKRAKSHLPNELQHDGQRSLGPRIVLIC